MNYYVTSFATSPFVQVALPIVATLIIASWNFNKRVDDIMGRLLSIEKRLSALEKAVDALQVRAWK